MDDFEDIVDKAELPSDGLKKLQSLIDEADMLDSMMDDLMEQLSNAQSRYNHIKTRELPDLMAELQTGEWTNEGGTNVKLDNFVSGSLPKEPAALDAAIKWIEENGGESLLKGVMEIPFNKSQHNEALALKDELINKGYPASYSPSIHAQTLMAFVREKLKGGEDVPLQTLGIFSGRVAKITHAGKSRATKAVKQKKGTVK